MTKLSKDDIGAIMLMASMFKGAGIAAVSIDTDYAIELARLANAYLKLLENSENEQLH